MPSRDTLKTLYLHCHSAYGHRLGMMLTKFEGLLPIEIRLIWMHIIWIWPFDHMVLRDHVTHWNHYISTNAMLMSTMLGRMVTNLEGLLPVMLLDPLVTWSWKVMWQTKTIISILTQCLQPPILGGAWLITRVLPIESRKILWSRGHARSPKTILYPLYLWP